MALVSPSVSSTGTEQPLTPRNATKPHSEAVVKVAAKECGDTPTRRKTLETLLNMYVLHLGLTEQYSVRTSFDLTETRQPVLGSIVK